MFLSTLNLCDLPDRGLMTLLSLKVRKKREGFLLKQAWSYSTGFTHIIMTRLIKNACKFTVIPYIPIRILVWYERL